MIGAGHNGLVAAGYLAKNGLAVLVLERSERIGGACVTRELIPGFKLSTGAQVLGMLRQRIIDDLELERHGFRYQLREPEIFVPFPDGRHLFFYGDAGRTMRSIAKIAPADAEAFPRYEAYTNRIARILNEFMLQPQPSMAQFAAFNGPDGADMLNCALFASVGGYLERFFASDRQGPAGLRRHVRLGRRPVDAGHGVLQVLPFRDRARRPFRLLGDRARRHGRVTDALAKAVAAYGEDIRLGAPVHEILCRAGRAAGVVLANGDEFAADVVLSNADPQTTLLRLAPAAACPARSASGCRACAATAAAPRSISRSPSCRTSWRCRAGRSARSTVAGS